MGAVAASRAVGRSQNERNPGGLACPRGDCTGTVPGSSPRMVAQRSLMTSVPPDLSPSDLERLFSAERLSTYVDHCDGDFNAAIGMYRWNAAITAAFWEPIGHLEVALRNTIDARLAARHDRLDRQGSWLDDPERELGDRARLDIASARDRVRQKGKRASDGQTISELSFSAIRRPHIAPIICTSSMMRTSFRAVCASATAYAQIRHSQPNTQC